MLRNCLSALACGSRQATAISRRAITTSFFDDVANFNVRELRPRRRPGRSWTVEELRLKANSDLHKLWFVCLKERNMLLTMRKACEHNGRYLPNPERIDKVEETMEAIKAVVDERDEAVLRLETGDGARPPERTITSFMGFTYKKETSEHLSPPSEATKEYEVPLLDDDAYMMQKLWVEKEHMKKLERHDEDVRRAMRTANMDKYKRAGPRVFNKSIPYKMF